MMARDKACMKARSALNEVIYDILTSHFTPAGLTIHDQDGTLKQMNLYGDPIVISEGVEVRLRDISGMVSPLFHPKYIRMLTEYVSKDSKLTNSFVDTLLDWQDADDLKHLNGAESYEYRSAGYQYTPRNYYIQVPEELMLLKGFDRHIFGKLKDDLSYWGTGAINFLTMSERLLRAVLRDDSLVDRIIQIRKEGVLTEKIFREMTGIPCTEIYTFHPSGWIRIKITGREGKAVDQIQAVFVKRETKQRPFMWTQWRR